MYACVLSLSGSMASPTSPWGPVLACGRPSSVYCWWPRMPARLSVTSHASLRKLSQRWSASSSSMRLWRSCYTWGCTTPSINTTTFRNSHSTRKCFFVCLFVCLIMILVSDCWIKTSNLKMHFGIAKFLLLLGVITQSYLNTQTW